MTVLHSLCNPPSFLLGASLCENLVLASSNSLVKDVSADDLLTHYSQTTWFQNWNTQGAEISDRWRREARKGRLFTFDVHVVTDTCVFTSSHAVSCSASHLQALVVARLKTFPFSFLAGSEWDTSNTNARMYQ